MLAMCLAAALTCSPAIDQNAQLLLAAVPPEPEALMGGQASDLYRPSRTCDSPGAGSSQEPMTGCRVSDLYGPSLQDVGSPMLRPPRRLPKGSLSIDLYSPSLQDAGSPVLEPRRQAAANGRAVDLYAPSSQAVAPPEMEQSEFAGLADGNSWDEGVGIPGVRGRRLGMVRRTMYEGDVDTLTLLYDLVLETPAEEPPRELSMVSLPTYRIEPPDTLELEAIKLVPRPPYRVATYDVLQIGASGTIPDQPISGYFLVEAEGVVSLGPAYGPVRVVGMTIPEATAEITRTLKMIVKQPGVTVSLARATGTEQISGVYQVQPDGTVNLRGYGAVHVAGKTVAEARVAVEQQMARYFDSPEVAVNVAVYNSKSYYVIIAGAGSGESVQRFPITGNETVLDAISQIQGLPHVSSKTMWVARPAPGNMACENVLPVNYVAIAHGGMTDTNYQLLPGDRVYIVDDKLVATNNYLEKVTAPIQRMLSITSLGANTIRNAQVMGRGYNLNRRGY
jgi:polysaccharide biosynthesis/export protein